MKLQIETPSHLIDVNGLGWTRSSRRQDGGLRIGALVRNTDLAADERVRRDYGVLSRALLAGASGQLRNKATTAGNLLQRTRCPYFYDTNQPCNKRTPGSGCAAIGGFSAIHAVLGGQRRLHRHPSQRHGVAMRALDATVETMRPDGKARNIPIADFHRLPGDTPHIETTLEAGRTDHRRDAAEAGRRQADLSQGARPRLLRVCPGVGGGDRAADGSGRVALGGVAHKPWRVEAAEAEMPQGAKAVRLGLAGRSQAHVRERIQADAGRAHARRGAGASEEV
jgi:xanthine dehydrogenase YagS FAD-binding subunit